MLLLNKSWWLFCYSLCKQKAKPPLSRHSKDTFLVSNQGNSQNSKVNWCRKREVFLAIPALPVCSPSLYLSICPPQSSHRCEFTPTGHRDSYETLIPSPCSEWKQSTHPPHPFRHLALYLPVLTPKNFSAKYLHLLSPPKTELPSLLSAPFYPLPWHYDTV